MKKTIAAILLALGMIGCNQSKPPAPTPQENLAAAPEEQLGALSKVENLPADNFAGLRNCPTNSLDKFLPGQYPYEDLKTKIKGPAVPSTGLICTLGTVGANSGAPVAYQFPTTAADFYQFTSQGLGTPQLKLSDYMMRPDPNGAYTFLVSLRTPAHSKQLFKVGPKQSFTATFTLKVLGANRMNAWAHKCLPSGTGKVTTSQSALLGTDEIEASASCPSDGPQNDPAEPQGGSQYGMQSGYISARFRIQMAGGPSGSATLESLGTHWNPPR